MGWPCGQIQNVGLLQNYIYGSFVVSVLSCAWQLENVPQQVLEKATRVLRKFAPGPGNWISKADLFHLKDGLGFQVAFPSVYSTALAAKLRVVTFEISNVRRRAESLRDLLLSVPSPPFPRSWYEQSHVILLNNACIHARTFKITAERVFQYIHARRKCEDAKPFFQCEATRLFLQSGPDELSFEWRMRDILARWPLQLAPRIAADRSISLLKRLSVLICFGCS